ncbi:MAG: tRNA-binding protein [Candidatus Magasanikbacteria bacterium CG_4_10_14_0_2_um_filter_41_10]|uniref:tRNA-binding protein n=1 Tax=Candidatus Magasanikbacteria bacterium CG_4_10_14_0_2_um_filter_41_10 TaxID=1974638 RepID=A0A2M7V6Y0_9BACT|nr:MAG: tRNA-binding protein [Candidatus Magasanikbacteria bacterium CG_4_10_14_0_2_um_filter_41_10]
MNTITWKEFENVLLAVGTILSVEEFPEAKKPAYKITADFGEFGVKKTSAQITTVYSSEELVGKQIIGVLNFPPKQIGTYMSEFLLTGFYREDGAVVMAVPEQPVPNGRRLS